MRENFEQKNSNKTKPKNKCGFVVLCLYIVMTWFAVGLPARGQVPPQVVANTEAAFDVATVRPFENNAGSIQRTISDPPHAGRFRATGFTLKALLSLAYVIPEDQIQGGPGWLSKDLYEINAKCDNSVDEQLKNMSDEDAKHAKQRMLQALLADRFNLKVHTAISNGTLYALVVSKHGSKLHPSGPIAPGVDPQSLFNVHSDGGTMVFTQCPISFLVGFLSEQTQHQILDKTGLTGRYDFQIRFLMQFHMLGPDAVLAGSDTNSPTIEDALSDQLGLKLESQKGQVGTLVVDLATKPTPN